MSDETEQNRSELPTSFKLKKAREKGSVARGHDLGFLIALATLAGCLRISGASIGGQIGQMSRRALISAPQVVAASDETLEVTRVVLTAVFRPTAFIAAAIFLAVLVFELIQTGLVFSTEPLRPDFSRLNPAKGLKRLFSTRMLVEAAKNVLKMAVYVILTALVISDVQRTVAGAVTDAHGLAEALGKVAFRLVLFALLAATVFAIGDQFIVRRDFLKKMRMSRREVRRESRDREGDPRMKQRRKQLHGEFVKLSQSVRGIRGADVLITNPTHYAVALKYDVKTMHAPTIVSQGAHQLASRLRRLAFVYGVAVVQKPELARALYRLPLNAEVPEIYYKMIADVYITMRDNKKRQLAESIHVS